MSVILQNNPVASVLLLAITYFPDRDAWIDSKSRVSYRDLVAKVFILRVIFKQHGILPGELIALRVKDEVLHYVASISLMLIGARQVTFASHDTEQVIERLSKALAPSALVTDCATRVEGLHVVGLNSYMIDLTPDNNMDQMNDPKKLLELLICTTAGGVLFRTSGTTGGLNVVESSADDLKHQAYRHPEYRAKSLLRFASIEHNNSKRHRLYVFFNSGRNVFTSPNDDGWVDLVCCGVLDMLDISRMHILELLHRYTRGELATLKIRTGGSSIPRALRREVMQNLSNNLYVRYAATEFGGISMADPYMHEMHGSTGCPLRGVNLEIVDETGTPLPEGQIGRIRLKGRGGSSSYVYTESVGSNFEKFNGGFFYPGDLGWVSREGHLIVEGRKDDMLIMNGLNIFPDEIQSSLECIAGVREAVCFAVDSRQHGDIPVAAVTLWDGASLSESELIQVARKSLALKSPRRIYIVDNLPLNAAGKYDRTALKTQLIDPDMQKRKNT